MNKAHKLILIGFLMITFHINIETLTILPEWFGWMIVMIGCKRYYEESRIRSYQGAFVLAMVQMVVTFCNFILINKGVSYGNYSILVTIGVIMLEMVFFYFLLKGMEKEMEGERRIECQKGLVFYLVAQTIAVCAYLAYLIWYEPTYETLGVFGLIGIRLLMMLYLYEVWKVKKEDE
ncbi:hypothetical protein lbkm_1504 [Lachnospiraceae bacterium KM106-2]|nr:hypothetical protein lbkm_1504 [Lachnospiraceae bacterium KM106-2]